MIDNTMIRFQVCSHSVYCFLKITGRKLFTDRSTFSSLVRSVRVQETDGEHRRQALASLREYITRTENIKVCCHFLSIYKVV